MICATDDLIYLASLLLCISLGDYYKHIQDVDVKRNYGAFLGMLVCYVLCGRYMIHSIVMVWMNIVLLTYCEKRHVHLFSLAFTWMYLAYVHLSVANRYVLWIHQALALRLVGLAFETHIAEKQAKNQLSSINFPVEHDAVLPINLNTLDVITYTFFFVGLHKGPYYRWKVFNEHFHTPFSVLGEGRVITEHKLKKALICSIAYFILRFQYTPNAYYDDNFYDKHGSDYRYLYNISQLMMFMLENQILTMLSTSVCTESGFGLYPTKCHAMPGYGPTTNFALLKNATKSSEIALKQDYNFSMLRCFNNTKLILGPKMKDTMKAWNIPTRYWFWACIYKIAFKRTSKETRSMSSFLAWTVWCGPHVQQLVISFTMWFYVNLESSYEGLYDTDGSMKLPWDIGYSIMRMLCLIYLTPCFIVTDSRTLLRYYNSIYWAYHFIIIVLFIGGLVVYKSRGVQK